MTRRPVTVACLDCGAWRYDEQHLARHDARCPGRPIEHGRLGSYTNYGCRCDECVDAQAEWARARGRNQQRHRILVGVPLPPEVVTDNGACRGQDPNLWVPVTPELPPREALEVCAGCPVRAECLAYAVEADVDGIWGGTTRRQRDRMRREARTA